ncbi:hypothetical protein BO83DRAFT_375978 [Aspergillus eucalypticola CBS 122712]|uniref:Uncharacterized protein n=1 Tax=Aspergillus eucalypticola (strain CBS 122712 / IBT 29274) TaxID=1448314 RepID=A0A317W2B6_ASPEC|nr:uncharacterized protein BO83DRAFT_375978 [Aspergillus eucalypticola CBS 122712]PWY80029.1 hypothetical protein BO83DRAFT_375978 [Aspergillus eucalypticola CBS 122712]
MPGKKTNAIPISPSQNPITYIQTPLQKKQVDKKKDNRREKKAPPKPNPCPPPFSTSPLSLHSHQQKTQPTLNPPSRAQNTTPHATVHFKAPQHSTNEQGPKPDPTGAPNGRKTAFSFLVAFLPDCSPMIVQFWCVWSGCG